MFQCFLHDLALFAHLIARQKEGIASYFSDMYFLRTKYNPWRAPGLAPTFGPCGELELEIVTHTHTHTHTRVFVHVGNFMHKPSHPLKIVT